MMNPGMLLCFVVVPGGVRRSGGDQGKGKQCDQYGGKQTSGAMTHITEIIYRFEPEDKMRGKNMDTCDKKGISSLLGLSKAASHDVCYKHCAVSF
jgi:hypothetical protein